MTSIGVYILSYNRPEYLREAVRSVLDQNRQADRIVVLDNGSGPDVKESIAAELGKGVIWVGAEKNLPSIWNHRRVLELAHEDLFYLMHDDDRLLPNFIECQVNFLDSHSDVIASGCNGYGIDQYGKRMNRLAREKGSAGIETYHNSAYMAELYSRSYIPFPSIVYRNGYPQKVGFEEKYGQMIDAVFLITLADLGPIAFNDDELFEYRFHPGQDSKRLNEDLYRLKEEFILDKTKGEPRISKKVRHRIRSSQTRRWIERSLSSLVRQRSLRVASVQFLATRPLHLDLATVYISFLVPSRYLKRILQMR